MAWWDLTVNNFEKTEVPFDIYSSGTFPNYLIVIDGFCIYKTTNTDGIYVNDYKTDIDYTNVLNIFYFKNKIYIIYDKLADYLYGAIYRFI